MSDNDKRPRDPGSLIERAAAKRSGASSTIQKPMNAPATGASAGVTHAAAAQQASPGIDPKPGADAAPSARPRDAHARTPGPGERRQTQARGQPRSKFERIDFQRLKSAGIIVPQGKRTRQTEEFRIIKRSVLHNVAEFERSGMANANLVMVTSTRPGEGKTFTAVNLAMSIAYERDRTVLLVDADFSRPNVPRTLGISARRGLIEVLENPSIDVADVMIRTSVESLSVLPAGGHHNLSTELLASDRMKLVIGEIARRYRDRVIIIDSPPVLSTSEPSVLAPHVAQIVFVVQADKTTKPAVKQAIELIDRGPRIGMVLNRSRREFGAAQFGSYYRGY